MRLSATKGADWTAGRDYCHLDVSTVAWFDYEFHLKYVITLPRTVRRHARYGAACGVKYIQGPMKPAKEEMRFRVNGDVIDIFRRLR